MTSLTKSALAGVFWNYTGIAVLVVAQIASTAVTARLIAPASFGAYAAALAAMGFASYFTISTVGLGILRRTELGEKTVGSAVTLSLTTATLVFVALWLIAVPWADAWNIHSAASLIRVLSFALFFTSLANVPLALLRRRLRFGVAALAETSTQVAGLTTGVVLAVFLHSALALAIGQAVAGVTLFLSAAVLARRDISFGFDRAEGRELFTYGSQLSVLYFGSFAVNTIPSWVIGRAFGAFTLGLYSRANVIITLPLTYLQGGIVKVLFPLYARVRDDAVRLRTLLSEGIVLATGFTWPLFALVAGSAPVVVDVLLGPRWHGATPLLRLTVLIACGLFPTGLLTNAAEALGWIRFAAFRLITLLALLGTAVVVTRLTGLGIDYLLVGVAIAQWITYAVMLKTFVSRGSIDSALVLRGHLAHALAALAAFGLALACSEMLAGFDLVVRVGGELVVAILVCGSLLVARSWFPASQILARRLAEVIPSNNRWYIRLRLESTR